MIVGLYTQNSIIKNNDPVGWVEHRETHHDQHGFHCIQPILHATE